MTKASDNAFPSVLVTEGTAPSTPAAGKQRVYIDSTTHHLTRINSSASVTDIEAGSSAAPTAHGARVTRSSGNVSVGNNTMTVIGFTSEDFDTDSMHDNSTNNSRLIVPTISGVTTGLWHCTTSGYTDSVASTARIDVQFRKNAAGSNSGGTLVAFTSGQSANDILGGFMLCADLVLSAADYIEVFVRTSGGSYNVVFDAGASPHFSMVFNGKVT